jgi:hypothetical protein
MTRQDELLEREDGRYFAIDKFGDGLSSIASTERLGKKNVSFGLPSGPALFLHLAHRAFSKIKDVDCSTLFDEHPQGRWPDDSGPLFDFFQNSMAHIVFSFTAIEAFANEVIPRDFQYTSRRKGKPDVILAKPDIERDINLDEKLSAVLPSVFSLPSPKGKKVWEKFKTIKKFRDRLVHLKSMDLKSSGPDVETIWGTMLKTHGHAWCDDAHAVIGYFKPAVENRRWFHKYPYE